MAFDPLQLDVAISDNEFNRVANSNDVKTYKLDECYRQKENVGKTTKHIIDVVALSTPYRNERKIRRFEQEHERVTALANNITFTNPHGYTKGYDNFHIQWLEFEVKRIQKTQMWQHWPSLLILTDGFKLPKDIRNVLRPISPKYRKELFLEEVEEVKGLEFQNVFVFISREIYNQLQEGFKGTGRTIYNKMRLMRIPFSRAKDSVVTFAIDIIKSDDGEDKFIVL